MSKYESTSCKRCSSEFMCKSGSITECQCFSVTVSDQTRAFLQTTYYDCLCANCLKEIDELIQKASNANFPRQREFLLEGLHYYKENGFYVFTEFYHLLRGKCCGNACRHCAYGFDKETMTKISTIST